LKASKRDDRVKHWQVMLAVRVTAYIDAPDDWDDSQGIEELACDAVSVSTWSEGVTLDLEHVEATDVVEVTK
jgi:hypothetical protein